MNKPCSGSPMKRMGSAVFGQHRRHARPSTGCGCHCQAASDGFNAVAHAGKAVRTGTQMLGREASSVVFHVDADVAFKALKRDLNLRGFSVLSNVGQ